MIYILCILTYLFAVYDAYGEIGSVIDALLFGLFALIAPLIAIGARFGFAKLKREVPILKWNVIAVALIGVSFYLMYALDGQSDPDTAGHGHILFFPVLYSFLSLSVSSFVLVLAWLIEGKHLSSNKNAEV
ncbi:MAG TPA: hypothetical protein VHT73_16465 [Thermodesulfobacteriota bacterium]|nr:hypothetical protein [Thermodesulfobacteriota bacterium]